jgi:hypothetical protein
VEFVVLLLTGVTVVFATLVVVGVVVIVVVVTLDDAGVELFETVVVVLVVELEVVSGRACKCNRFLDLAACIIA